jgi:hypothetical protein
VISVESDYHKQRSLLSKPTALLTVFSVVRWHYLRERVIDCNDIVFSHRYLLTFGKLKPEIVHVRLATPLLIVVSADESY